MPIFQHRPDDIPLVFVVLLMYGRIELTLVSFYSHALQLDLDPGIMGMFASPSTSSTSLYRR